MLKLETDIKRAILEDLEYDTKVIMETQGLVGTDVYKSINWTFDGSRFTMFANDYYQYIDSGRKAGGKRVPVESILTWIRKKNIRPRNEMTINSLAYIIQRSINRKGIFPRPMTQRIVGVSLETISERILDDLVVKVADEITMLLTTTIGKN